MKLAGSKKGFEMSTLTLVILIVTIIAFVLGIIFVMNMKRLFSG